MIPVSMTLSDTRPTFQGHSFVKIKYVKMVQHRAIVTTEHYIGRHKRPVEQCHFQLF